MNRWSVNALFVLCSSLLVACPQAPGARSYESAEAVLRALEGANVDCSGVAPAGEGELVRSGVKCDLNGERVVVRTFSDAAAKDRWLLVGGGFGANLVGPNWVVTTQRRETAQVLQDALGGSIR